MISQLLLKQAGIIPEDAPAEQIAVFLKVCETKGLNPESKEIYLVESNGKYIPLIGIEGARKLADLSGKLAGKDPTLFNGKPMSDFDSENETLRTAEVTVYKMVDGTRCAFTKQINVSEFIGPSWNGMRLQMAAKTAELHALKSAFGAALSGLYIREELPAFEKNSKVKIEKIEAKPELKPELKPDGTRWLRAKKAIENGSLTIEQLEEKYYITQQNKDDLCLVTA